MHGEIAATRDGKILGLRVDVLADHGAFNGTAQPTKFPAGFFHIFTGSYDYAGRALQGHRASTPTRRPAGSPTPARSASPRRSTSSSAWSTAWPTSWHGPGRAADEEPPAARAVPVHDADRLGVRLGRLPGGADRGDAHRRLRRAAGGAGGAARRPAATSADGHRPVVLHRGRRRRPAQAHGHPRPRHGRRLRAAGAPDRQGGRCGIACRPRARATRRPSPRSSRTSSASRPRTSRSSTATPTTRRSGSAPTAPARRRCRARPRRSWRGGSRTRRGSSPPPRSSARPTTSSGSTAAGTSRATRARARRSRRSPCWRTAPSSCPTAWRATSTRRSSTTRRT